jgi:hypothetical protein
MSKQDGSLVRTASDLERKYRLYEMQRAFEQSEKSITRINKILQDYVNTIVGTLDNFDGLADGHIATYFYEGVPTLENAPAIEWTDGYENHVNDFYYDRSQGKVYTFIVTDGVYSWEEVIDENKINVLAMANATVDTKDNKRRIFLEQPIPPYDNGDLWLKDGVIYACQISKPSEEVYEQHDFILSSEYSGDTLAIKIGKELEVLKGTVLKVIEDADFLRVSIEDLDNETVSSIELIKNQLATLITDENGQSMMTQTADGVKFEMKNIIESLNNTSNKVTELEEGKGTTEEEIERLNEIAKKLEEKTAYVDIGTDEEGNPTVILGASNSDFKLVITNTEFQFYEGANIPASMSNETMNIKNVKVDNSLQIGSLAWIKRGNGHISFMPKGVIN